MNADGTKTGWLKKNSKFEGGNDKSFESFQQFV